MIIVTVRIPMRKGAYCYARCLDPTEFWVALLEKAYAKVHGSYEVSSKKFLNKSLVSNFKQLLNTSVFKLS